MSVERRRKAYRFGHRAELIALFFLMCKGYWPLGRRFAGAGGEIDLIMRRGDVVAFVEVKARTDLMSAVHAIDHRKQVKFSRAVQAWVQRNPQASAYSFRCDAVYVVGGWRLHHVQAAFELGW